MPKKYEPCRFADVKAWIVVAIKEEERRDSQSIWIGEKSAIDCANQRLQRIRFLQKQNESNCSKIGNRLASCKPGFGCLSGACPECGRLLQRWFVRKSKIILQKLKGVVRKEIVAVTIAPISNLVAPGHLKNFSISDLQRRLKWGLDAVSIAPAIGGVDFSFNEARDQLFKSVWSVHAYIITTADDRKRLQRNLRDWFKKNSAGPADAVLRPVKVSPIENTAYRRSYALKMNFDRRVSYRQMRINKGRRTTVRNTSKDRLKAAERVELFQYLDDIGLAARIVLRGFRPFSDSQGGMKLKAWT